MVVKVNFGGFTNNCHEGRFCSDALAWETKKARRLSYKLSKLANFTSFDNLSLLVLPCYEGSLRV